MLTRTSESFTNAQKGLHWAVVVLLILQYYVVDGVGRPFRQLMESGTATYSVTVVLHILFGAAILFLALWRIALRLRHGAPAAPEDEPDLAKLASRIVQGLMYLLLIALPVLGAAAWFGQIGPLGELHEVLTNVLLALAVLHVAAVVVHQYVWKTGLLNRMT